MYLGRYQTGDTLLLTVQCLDASGVAVMPTDAPQVKVWSGSARVETYRMPCLERYARDGLFSLEIAIDWTYQTGMYSAEVFYTDGTYNGIESFVFEVLPGGHPDGACLSTHFYRRPHADFLVRQLQNGKIVFGRNPRVT